MGKPRLPRPATSRIWQIGCLAGALIAGSFAAMHQFAASGPDIATPNARVADTFSALPSNVTTALASFKAALPNLAAEAKADSRLSANEIVAAAFRDAAPQSVMSSAEYSSPRQARILEANASLDALPIDSDAMLRLDAPPAAPLNPNRREQYLKYYVYSETPPPEKPSKIALAALRSVPLGTPVVEIERAADAFDVDVNFMKAVAKIESDFNPKNRTGSYVGLFQLSKSEFSKYGSGDILSPRDNAMAAAYKFANEAALGRSRRTRQPSAADRLEVDVRNPGGRVEGRTMVQARDLGQHAAGSQTRMDVGRPPHLGRVRDDVARARRHALCPDVGIARRPLQRGDRLGIKASAPQHRSLQLAAPVTVIVLHEVGPAIPADVAVPVMLLLRLSQIILGRSLQLR